MLSSDRVQAAIMQRGICISLPVIAKAKSIAKAAGCQLDPSCDLSEATEDARCACYAVNTGVSRSNRLGGAVTQCAQKMAREMLLLGECLLACRVALIRLVNRIVLRACLEETALETAHVVADTSTMALPINKRAVYKLAEMHLADAYALAGRIRAKDLMNRDTEPVTAH